MRNGKKSIAYLSILYSKKMVHVYIAIFIALSFFKFREFLLDTNLEKNFFDYILFIFNDFFVLFYMISVVFMIIMYPIAQIKREMVIRFQDRKDWFKTAVGCVFMIALIMMAVLLIIMLLQALITLKFNNGWSEYALYKYAKYEMELSLMNPLSLVLSNLLLVFLYLSTLGLIFFVSNIYIGNSVFALLITIGINCGSIIIFLSRLSSFYFITFVNNTIFFDNFLSKSSNNIGFIYSLAYWLILIGLLLLGGRSKVCKLDF